MKSRTYWVLAVVVAMLVSCSDHLTGRYANPENSKEFIEFGDDGRYMARIGKLKLAGRYKLDETRLVLIGMGGREFLAEVEGEGKSIRMIDEESAFSGKDWIKR